MLEAVGDRAGAERVYLEGIAKIKSDPLLVDTYIARRESPSEPFIAAFRRLGKEPFKEALYGNA